MTSTPPIFRRLSIAGRAYLLATLAAACGSLALAVLYGGEPELQPALLVLATALCGAAALFQVFAPGNLTMQLNLVFFALGVVLLPSWAVAVLAVACFAPTAAATRERWYITGFNVANYALAGLAGHELAGRAGWMLAEGRVDARGALGLLGAAVAIVVVNHVLLVGVVRVAQQRPLARAVSESLTAAPADLALAVTGVCLGALWQVQEALTLLAAGPLVLMYRALWVPILQHRSRTDAKTGLLNLEHFTRTLADTLDEAARRELPVAIAMLDIDHLRALNARWGHLAGDELIRGIARLLADAAGPDAVAARLGGEEFCLMLPGMSAGEARTLVESLRHHVERMEWAPGDGDEPMRATVSAGIAALPSHGTTPDALLRAADAAVYDAKLGGRNRVRVAPADDGRASLPAAGLPHPLSAVNPVGAGEAAAETAAAAFAQDAPGVPARGGHAAFAGDASMAAAEEPAAGGNAAFARDAPTATEELAAGPAALAHPRLVGAAAAAMALAAVLVGAVSPTRALADQPALLVLLVGAVVLLDRIRIDVFERGLISPAAVPTLALAAVFGPLGPLASEAAIALVRLARRSPLDRTLADLGALGLAGAAAAGAFAAFPAVPWGILLVAGLVAGLAYYLVNVTLLTTMMALARGTSPLGLFREGHAWLWPHYLAFGALASLIVVTERSLGPQAVLLFVLPVLVLWLAEKQYLDRSRSSVDELRRSHDELQQTNARLREALAENQELLARARRSYLSTITSLARTIEAKDPYTGGHTERVADIASRLAEALGFDEDQLRAVNVGAVIHDIGKIGVPDRVLLKPGKLDPDELADIRRHPEISSYILADLDLPPIVKQMVRSHHERYDGGGYPDGLCGEEIPLAARILSVADAMDAMTSDRPYRPAMSWEAAIAEVRAQAGTQFCPLVVDAVERSFGRELVASA